MGGGDKYFIEETKILINSLFDKTEHSIRTELNISPSRKQRYFNTNLIYAQANRFFQLPGRLNLEIGGFFTPPNKGGYAYNFAILGISQDLILPLFISASGNLFIGTGIGLYIKSQVDTRVGSKVTFTERFFLGYMIKNFSLELYWKHYSNGTLMLPNSGHDFGGLSFGYNF